MAEPTDFKNYEYRKMYWHSSRHRPADIKPPLPSDGWEVIQNKYDSPDWSALFDYFDHPEKYRNRSFIVTWQRKLVR